MASWVRLRPNWSSTSEPDGVVAAGAAGGGAGLLALTALALGARAGVARQELDDLLAHPGQVGAQLHEHLGGDALALTDEAEEDVLGADVVVAELQRLAQRQLEDLLGPGGEGDVAAGRRAALADDLLDLAAHGLERDAERLERLGGDALALVDEPEQDVLGADVVVVEEACLLLRQDHDSAGPVGESFEQGPASQSAGFVGRVYRPPPLRPVGRPATSPSTPWTIAQAVRDRALGFRRRGRRVARLTCADGSRTRSSRCPHADTDLDRVEEELRAAVAAADRGLTEIASHLIGAGGKRVRPAVRRRPPAAAGDGADGPGAADVVRGGVSVELVHLGSLYHDDVMDEAATRRTVESVNARWGNLQAILAGDFLLAKASEIAASLGTEVAGLLAATIGRLCEGQVLELAATPTTSTAPRRPTWRPSRARPPRCSPPPAASAASWPTSPAPTIDRLTEFGRAYGMAFQIVDDILDVIATDEQLGKPAGHDLVEGVYTLPMLRALAGPAGRRAARAARRPDRGRGVGRGPGTWCARATPIDESVAVAQRVRRPGVRPARAVRGPHRRRRPPGRQPPPARRASRPSATPA